MIEQSEEVLLANDTVHVDLEQLGERDPLFLWPKEALKLLKDAQLLLVDGGELGLGNRGAQTNGQRLEASL